MTFFSFLIFQTNFKNLQTVEPCSGKRRFQGGYLDFSHLTELNNIYITEIYMRKHHKSSKIKNKKITKVF